MTIKSEKGDYYALKFENITPIQDKEKLDIMKGLHELAASEIMPKSDISTAIQDEDDGDLPF